MRNLEKTNNPLRDYSARTLHGLENLCFVYFVGFLKFSRLLGPRDRLPEVRRGFQRSQRLPEAPEAPKRLPEASRGSQVASRGFHRLSETPRGSQRIPEAARGSQRFPGAPRGSQRLPYAPKYSQRLPEAFKGSQRFPEASRDSQKFPEAPRGFQNPPQPGPLSLETFVFCFLVSTKKTKIIARRRVSMRSARMWTQNREKLDGW